MSLTERRKGSRGELEVLALIRRRWPSAHRNFGSGSQGHGDIAYGPQGVWWEIKRTERLRLRDAWRQAESAAQPFDLPVVATRWDRGQWLAVLPLEELLALLELRERG